MYTLLALQIQGKAIGQTVIDAIMRSGQVYTLRPRGILYTQHLGLALKPNVMIIVLARQLRVTYTHLFAQLANLGQITPEPRKHNNRFFAKTIQQLLQFLYAASVDSLDDPLLVIGLKRNEPTCELLLPDAEGQNRGDFQGSSLFNQNTLLGHFIICLNSFLAQLEVLDNVQPLWQLYRGLGHEGTGEHLFLQLIEVDIRSVLVQDWEAYSSRLLYIQVLVSGLEVIEPCTKYRWVKESVLSIDVHRVLCKRRASHKVSVLDLVTYTLEEPGAFAARGLDPVTLITDDCIYQPFATQF